MKTILATIALMAGQAAAAANEDYTFSTTDEVCTAGVDYQNGAPTSYYSTIFTAPDTIKYQLCEEYAVKWCSETAKCKNIKRHGTNEGIGVASLGWSLWEGTLGDGTAPTLSSSDASSGYKKDSYVPTGCSLIIENAENPPVTWAHVDTPAELATVRFTYYLVWNDDITVGMSVQTHPNTTPSEAKKKRYKHIGHANYDTAATAYWGGDQILQEYKEGLHANNPDGSAHQQYYRDDAPSRVSIDAYYAATTCPAQIRAFRRRISLCGVSATSLQCQNTKIEDLSGSVITADNRRTLVGGSTATSSVNKKIKSENGIEHQVDITELFAGCAFILPGDVNRRFGAAPYTHLGGLSSGVMTSEADAIPIFIKKMKSGSTRTTFSSGNNRLKISTSRRTGSNEGGTTSRYSTDRTTLEKTDAGNNLYARFYQHQRTREMEWVYNAGTQTNGLKTCRMYCSDAVGKDSIRRFVFPSATDDNYDAQSLCSDCSVAETTTSYAGVDPTDGVCKTCPEITGAVDLTYTCSEPSNQFKSVFNTPITEGQCTDDDEAPHTSTEPHTCGTKGNGCPAGFKQKNHECANCEHARTNSSFINTDTCRDDSGCACLFDPGYKSSKSAPAKYETAAGGRTGRCKFKSMNDLFEYRYELYEGTDQDKEGIVKHMKNVTGSSVEEFVKQDYLLRKTTVRVSLTKYDDAVTDDNVQGYKYYNFDKQQATESWIEFDSSANPAAKSGKVQDLGTICWIKPSSNNDCIFDPANSCDRDFTKAQYMAAGHSITANGETVMTDDCDIIQFVEPLIDTRAVSASIPDLWQTDLDITSTGDDIIGTIIRGFTPNGDSHVMKDEVETKIAMHKLIGIASECIDASAQTHARTQPGAAANANSENIFAWGDLQARVKFNMVAKVKLLRSEQGSDTGYLIDGFTIPDPTADNKKSDLFDLLFVSGENIMDANVELNGVGQTQGNMVFQRLTNGPQSSFNQLIVDHDSFICTTSLDIKTSGGNFDCFGAGSTATGDSAQTQTEGYFHTTLGSDGYYGHTWDQQAIVNNTAEYNNISDWISQLAVTTPSLHAATPCTASVETTCDARIIKVTDHRKCFNFHGMDAGNPIDQFNATNEAVNNTSIYDLLDATGACEKPKEDASTVESEIAVHTVVVERLRLSTERVFPGKEVSTGGTTLFESEAAVSPTYLNVHYPISTSDWECDDPACTTDPYHVIYNVDAPHDNSLCLWTDGHDATVSDPLLWSRGAELLTGCKDNETSLVSNCGSPLEVIGQCPITVLDSGDLDLYMPPASFPHFYVYAMSTVSSMFPETDSIGASNWASTTNQIISTKTRRLGSKKLLASKSKLLASKGRKLTLSKSRFVISKTHILH